MADTCQAPIKCEDRGIEGGGEGEKRGEGRGTREKGI